MDTSISTPYKTYFNWSSGKDSALALYYLIKDSRYNVDRLITTVNAHHKRVSMHGLREDLLLKQLEAIDIPYDLVELPEIVSNDEYGQILGKHVKELKEAGFNHTAFGDIFLEDLRAYRETQLKQYDIQTLFPLWNKDSSRLIHEFLDLGFKTVVVCVNGDLLDKSFAGRVIDENFIKDLPSTIDPCGENGEFHTFCFDAPYFKHAVDFTIGETVLKEYSHGEIKSRFWFSDLLTSKS